MIKHAIRSIDLKFLVLLIGSLLILSAALSLKWYPVSAAAPITWDGGGSTNNWSDAANWSGDTVPSSGDDVIFDSTSTKDVTIDTNIAISSIKIDTGYTGTITQSDAASISISGCLSRPCFVQNSGTFNGSSNTITLTGSGFGALTLNGGAFNGGSGDITAVPVPNQFNNYALNGGTFRSTSGTLTVTESFNLQGSSFINNLGTIKFVGNNNASIIASSSFIFNNVNIDKSNADIFILGQVVVAGTLSLNDGSISNNGNIVEARGAVSISPDFDGGNATLEFANGTGPRQIVLSTAVNLPKIEINDPNVTVDTSGVGTLHFAHQFFLDQGVFNQGGADLLIEPLNVGGGTCFQQTGGTFNGSTRTITLNGLGFGAYTMTGGMFNGGTGDITVTEVANQFNTVSLGGGTFKSTSGTLGVPDNLFLQGSTFVHNSGTVEFFGTRNSSIISAVGDIFNNVIVDKSGASLAIGGRLVVHGSLSLNDGSIVNNQNTVEARGGLSIAPEFDGGDAILELANGSGARNITLSAGVNLPRFVINDPNVTVGTAGAGTLHFPRQLALDQGVFNQGGVDLLIEAQAVAGAAYLQNSGVFNASSNTITINSTGFGAILMNGGTFNGGAGAINLFKTADGGQSLNLQGGTFKSTSGTLTLTDTFILQGAGTTFLHNNGTVNFTAVHDAFISNDQIHASITFNNVIVNLANGVNLATGPNMIVLGELDLDDGSLTQSSATIESRGPTIVGPNFDGGIINFTFGGTADQTFTNNGGINLSGTWTINKASGTVAAATDIILGTSQAFKIISGTLFLNSGSDLTVGDLTVGDAGKLVNDSSTTITLGGNVSNAGVIDLQGGGAACPEAAPKTILLRSSVAGTQRTWTKVGSGTFRMVDVDVKDQAGTAAITVFSGTNGGNNGANFTFNPSCPTDLSISPAVTSVVTGASQSFTAGGGFGTRTFSIAVNNSGGTINSGTGLYTAGSTADVNDTVRVTDGLGQTADASVTVTGPANKLAFTVQPASSTAGQTITPSIQVSVEDANGVTVANATNSVTLAFANNAGGGTLSGAPSHNAINGVATFGDISINKSGIGYTLKATAGSLTQTTSAAFNINAASPAKLVFSVQPQDSSITSVIAPPIEVVVQDTFGNLVTTANNSITIGIGNNPGSSTLTGTNPKSAVSGIATFSDLNLDKPGNGYTLTASATALTGATSNSFNITSPFIVTNMNDSGPGSLRDAINNANAAPGTQTIGFNIIGTAPFVITPTTALPPITDSVIIDGTTQPGFAGAPLVEISGQIFAGTSPVKLFTDNCTVKGLSIVHFAEGIRIGGSHNVVSGNLIGLTTSGTPLGNSDGISIESGSDNLIGGSTASDRNVLSGNGYGIRISSALNTIQGNLIGTDVSGSSALANGNGMILEASAVNNVVENNVISGNSHDGIQILGSGNTHDNVVENNIIGLDATGVVPLGNGEAGIQVGGFSNNNHLSANAIFANGTLGILLGQRSVTASGPPLPNDPQDPDGGANNQQNYPIITTLNFHPSSIDIGGTLNSTPTSSFGLEFFSSPSCDPSGNGQGAVFLGAGNVLTGSTGNGSFNVTLPVAVDSSQFITATASDAKGNTSEFSQCKGPQLTIQGTVKNTAAQPISGVTVKIHNNITNVDKFVTTDSVGHYILTNQSQGQTYTIDAIKTNFVVSSSLTSTDANGNITKTFSMQQIAATIIGHVTSNGSSLSGVTMTLSGGANATATTDSSGNFSFPNLVTGISYTVTPSRLNFTFAPTSSTFTVNSDQTANFTATNLLANLPGRIVFASNGNINTMNANGTGLATIFTSSFVAPQFNDPTAAPPLLPVGPGGSQRTFENPNFSQDGAKTAFIDDFESFSNGNSTISLETSNPDGSGAASVIGNGAGSLSRMNFSPDGTKLAAGKLVNGVTQLVTVKVSDGSTTTLVSSGTTNSDPDWSPDGTKLIFARDDSSTSGTNKAIFVVDSTGSNLTKKTTPSFSDTSPRWAPNNTKIAFLRSTAAGGPPKQIVTMNLDGSGQTIIYTTSASQILDLRWAPDSSRLAFMEGSSSSAELASVMPDGSSKLAILSSISGGASTFDWGPTQAIIPPIGNNINVNIGNISLGFTGITGLTAVSAPTGSQPTIDAELISPASVGNPPAGYVLGDIAYQINTTATFTPPVTVCIDVPGDQYPTAASFNEVSLLHDENGTLVDVTTSRDSGLHRVCGQVDTLGNFVIAEQVNNALPRISGIVVDQNGDPLDDFTVSLSGDASQQATTGVDGSFSFVNLTDAGSYLVTPTRVGYLFSAPFQAYDALSGEQTVVFVATPANFSVSGAVVDGDLMPQENVKVTLSGTASAEVVTGPDGTYSFDGLPANGTYLVTPSLPGTSFSPQQLTVDALQDDLSGVDFVGLLPTAAPVSISGRVIDNNGSGVSGTRLTLTDSRGETHTALTNPFGYYSITGVPVGTTYILSAARKGYQFHTRVITITDSLSGVDFIGVPSTRGLQPAAKERISLGP